MSFINQVDGSGKFFTSNVNTDNISVVNVSATNLTTTTFSPVNVNASVIIANESDIGVQNSSTINTSTINASTSNVSTKNVSQLNVNNVSAIQVTTDDLILPSNGAYDDASIQTLTDQLRIKAGASNSIGFLTNTDVNMVYDGDLNISSNLNASIINASNINTDSQLSVLNSTGKKFTIEHQASNIQFYGSKNNNSVPSNFNFYTDAGGVGSTVKLKINKDSDVVEVVSLEATSDILTGDVVCDTINTSDFDALEVNTSTTNTSFIHSRNISNDIRVTTAEVYCNYIEALNISTLDFNTSTADINSLNISTISILDQVHNTSNTQLIRDQNVFKIVNTEETDIEIYSNTGTQVPQIRIPRNDDKVEIPTLNAVEINGTTINTDGTLNASVINCSIKNVSEINTSHVQTHNISADVEVETVLVNCSLMTTLNISSLNSSINTVNSLVNNTSTINSSILNSSTINSSNVSITNMSCSNMVDTFYNRATFFENWDAGRNYAMNDYYSTSSTGPDGINTEIIYPAFRKLSVWQNYNILNMMAFNNDSTVANRFINVPCDFNTSAINTSAIDFDLAEGTDLNSSTINCSTLNASNFTLPSDFNASNINTSTLGNDGELITVNTSVLFEHGVTCDDTFNVSEINCSQFNVNEGTPTNVTMGHLELGDVGYASFAGLRHRSVPTNEFMILQSNAGLTIINGASDQGIHFRMNNTTKWRMETDGSISVMDNVNVTNKFGKGILGSFGTGNGFGIANRLMGNDEFMIFQNNLGNTTVNCGSEKIIIFSINNVSCGKWTSDGNLECSNDLNVSGTINTSTVNVSSLNVSTSNTSTANVSTVNVSDIACDNDIVVGGVNVIDAINLKQDELTAGDGINITGSTISKDFTLTGIASGTVFTNVNFSTSYSTATIFFPDMWNNQILIDSNYYTYTSPSPTTNNSTDGVKILVGGYYKISYTVNLKNVSFNNRVNARTRVLKNGSIGSPLGVSFSYLRDDNFVLFGSATLSIINELSVNDYIKISIELSKNDDTFNDTLDGVELMGNSVLNIEYLG